jgi:hypothetical protein
MGNLKETGETGAMKVQNKEKGIGVEKSRPSPAAILSRRPPLPGR